MKKILWATYIGLASVFVLSLGVPILIPMGEALQSIFILPGVGALVAALWQILKDNAAFEKQRLLQKEEKVFSLGVTSHMATVAFDKHVAFAEKYMEGVHRAISALFQEGPNPVVGSYASELTAVRREYSAWIPLTTAAPLESFEGVLKKIGTMSEGDWKSDGKADPEIIGEMYSLVRQVFVLGDYDESKSELAAVRIMEKVRDILGVNELTRMRSLLVKEALKYLEK